MKNQPDGPGCFFVGVLLLCAAGVVKFSRLPAPIGVGENGIAAGWLLIIASLLLFFALGIAILPRLDMKSEVEQSGDIESMTWTVARFVGMAEAQDLRNQVAELKYPDTNNGIWKWKSGHSLSSFQDLALKKYDIFCSPMPADELLEKG